MTNILRIDASVRAGIAGKNSHGSQSRRLTELFQQTWHKLDANIQIKHRDVGLNPPPFIDEDWIIANFGHSDSIETAEQKLKLSNELINELHWADVIIIGTPLYNFGMPSNLKSYIDHIVRINKTYAFNIENENPYSGLLDAKKPLIIFTARGSHGFDEPDAPFANHLEAGVKTAFNFIGLEKFHEIAIEYQEYGGELLEKSIQDAEANTLKLVQQLHQNFA